MIQFCSINYMAHLFCIIIAKSFYSQMRITLIILPHNITSSKNTKPNLHFSHFPFLLIDHRLYIVFELLKFIRAFAEFMSINVANRIHNKVNMKILSILMNSVDYLVFFSIIAAYLLRKCVCFRRKEQ